MATKIVLSDIAPSDAKRFTLGQFEIEVPTETDDTRLIAEAYVHPWLAVEADETAAEALDVATLNVDPTKDPLSADFQGKRDDEGLPESTETAPLAVEAGLDQNKAVTDDTGETAVTLAAVDSGDTKATSKSKTKGS